MKINLNGTWHIKCCQYTDSHEYVFLSDFFPEGWLEAQVPGDIRIALKKQGLIDGNYFGKNLDKERWIDNLDWLYLCQFPFPEGKGIPYLELDGVDTLAEVWLNGKLLGKCENMFLKYIFPIIDALKEGQNTLLIRIRSTVKSLEGKDRTGLYPQNDTDRLMLRKSQMNFGWDFCGHCLTHGLWKNVSIYFIEHAKLDAPYLRTVEINNEGAKLSLKTGIAFWNKNVPLKDMKIGLRLFDDEKICFENYWDVYEPFETKMECFLSKPKLWFPRPYGDHFLYYAEVTLRFGDEIWDTKTFRFGVRTIELLQNPIAEGGREFIFKINGRKLFIRGANWVPTRAIYAEIKQEEVCFFLKRAVEANLTMLRVWGGGIYESDEFFDFCDQHGLLIMQDFMLACGVLPQNDSFLKNVSDEVSSIIKKYRNHPSIAIWSADNELDEAYRWYDILPLFKTNKVNRIAVREAVKKEDPFRPFLVSSPCSPFEQEEGGMTPILIFKAICTFI